MAREGSSRWCLVTESEPALVGTLAVYWRYVGGPLVVVAQVVRCQRFTQLRRALSTSRALKELRMEDALRFGLYTRLAQPWTF